MSIYKKYPPGYYVYAYIRHKDSKNGKAGTPYYIGKGKGQRAWNKTHRVKVPKESWAIVIIMCDLTEIGALMMERKLIQLWGRLDINTGILRNLTNGGESNYGLVHNAKTREKMSQSAKGKKKTPEHIEKIASQKRGKPANIDSEILKRRGESISKAKKGKPNGHLGKTRSDESRAKMSLSQRLLCYKHSDDIKKVMSEKKKGKPWTEARRYAQMNRNKENKE